MNIVCPNCSHDTGVSKDDLMATFGEPGFKSKKVRFTCKACNELVEQSITEKPEKDICSC